MYGYYEYPDVDHPAGPRGDAQGRPLRPAVERRSRPSACASSSASARATGSIGNEYCSKVCCGIASKQAIEVRQAAARHQGLHLLHRHADVRLLGERDLLARPGDSTTSQYVKGIVTEIVEQGRPAAGAGRGHDDGPAHGGPMDIDRAVGRHGSQPRHAGRCRRCWASSRTSTASSTVARRAHWTRSRRACPGSSSPAPPPGPKDLEDTASMGGAAAMRAVGAIRGAERAGAAAGR